MFLGMNKSLFLSLFAFFYTVFLFAQMKPEPGIKVPVDIPVYLSGNFGELRTNHFHTGIDFKTQGVVGKNIINFDHGWLSRVVVSPWGYGNALYVSHYSGLTTVYAHMLSFTPEIANIVENLQYENENFNLDVSFAKDEITLCKGQILGLSGNSGSSGGPHLHFEIRDTETEVALDPMPYFFDKIKDTTPPEFRLLRLYPQDSAVVNGDNRPVSATPFKDKSGKKSINKKLEAWGRVAVGVKSYDKMDGAHNIYGVRNVKLYVDSLLYFETAIDEVSFDHSRFMNSFIDYRDWVYNRSMVMRLFVEPGNELPIYLTAVNNGVVTIDEEREYNCRVELVDVMGNRTIWPFVIVGKKAKPIERVESNVVKVMPYGRDNLFQNEYVTLKIGKNTLYSNLSFTYSKKEYKSGLSALHSISDKGIPLHKYVDLHIKVDKDSLDNKEHYYLARVNNNRTYYVASTYEDGYMKARVRDFGDYVVLCDSIAPKITPISSTSWIKRGQIRYKITDNASGVSSYRGEIDGQYVLFAYDGKTATLSYNLDERRLKRNRTHTLKLTVIDSCGNESIDEREFFW